jgi:hypothetical protein
MLCCAPREPARKLWAVLATHVLFLKRVSQETRIQRVVIYDEPALSNCIAASQFGEPVYEDEEIVAFDLRREPRPEYPR